MPAESLKDQTNRVFHFIYQAVELANDKAWQAQEGRPMGIWQHVVHMTQSLHFYTSGKTIKEWDWNSSPLGLDYEDKTATPPDKEQVKDYITSVQKECLVRIGERKATILAEEKACPWVGKTYLDRVIYVLRHTAHHVGEINQVLISHGLEPVKQDR